MIARVPTPPHFETRPLTRFNTSPPDEVAVKSLFVRRFSVRVALVSGLICLVGFAAAVALFTRHNLSFRIHDYAVLNLAGQMRELANGMQLDAQHLAARDAADIDPAEALRYRSKLALQVRQYDRILQSFVTRELSPDLTGLDAPVSCSWDADSLAAVQGTAARWQSALEPVTPALGPAATLDDIHHAAQALAHSGTELLDSSRQLTHAFKALMQNKLDFVIAAQLVSVALAVAFGLLAFLLVHRNLFTPIAEVERAARRVALGDFSARAVVTGGRETAQAASALNGLAGYVQALFDLNEKVASDMTIGDVLDTIRRELSARVPIDSLVVAVGSAGTDDWRILRSAGAPVGALQDGHALNHHGDAPGAATEISLCARDAGCASVASFVLDIGPGETAVLMVAAKPAAAYGADRMGLLKTAAAHVAVHVQRTRSTDALVIAAVEGLAKLAKSRDPETGDHLLRMSMYSSMISTELGQQGQWSGTLNMRFVEDLRRFAPMHDIGKVGISDSILLKPGRLSDDERAEMSRHPTIGADVLRRCEAQMQARGRSVFQLAI